MQRRDANIIGGGGWFATLIGWCGPWLLRFFSLPDASERLRAVMELFQSDKVSWPGIYLIAFCFFSAWLIGFNWDLGVRRYRRWLALQPRDFRMTGCDAVRYIATQSFLGHQTTGDLATREARRAFIEAGAQGRLVVRARKPDSVTYETISRHEFQRAFFDPQSCGRDGTGGRLVCSNEEQAVMYIGLLVDRTQVSQVWPEKPSATAWMRV